MKTIALFLVAVMFAAAAAGCGGPSPVAPDAPPAALTTLSGQVQQSVTWGDPPLADALVEVIGADGLKRTGLSDDDGFYTIAAVAPGSVTVTASKPGFATRTSEFVLRTDTVLNFSLIPE